MKTGVILYVTGAGEIENSVDILKAVGGLSIKADRVETVLGSSACFDVMDAWWRLTVKGMKKVECMFAEVTANRELRLTGRTLRLCG
ncbi:MAG: hypothetical protein J7M32_13565 [Deltaproteobacteria bacterium]|nr:hypothetical protein [Deltaproteobacteria bacterium]